MTFFSLGSGSCGNCYYISTDTDAIIIDCGVGINCFKRTVRNYGLKIGHVKGILITHDHSDHVKAAGKVSDQYHLPVYATPAVHSGIDSRWQAATKVPKENRRNIQFGETFTLGPFAITPFPIPHDASENTGYHIVCGDVRLTLMTDVGKATDEVKSYIAKSTHLILESNYDVQMLSNGPYPTILKQRISCGTGHLSNTQAATALAENMTDQLKNVWLCHLSADNNRPEIAQKTMTDVLRQHGVEVGQQLTIEPLKRKEPSGPYQL
mgnify:CR=1 FL=1